MNKVKEAPTIKDNGEKKKISKAEMIERLEKEIKQLEIAYHQKTGALSYLKEID